MRVWSGLLDLFFPPKCPFCGKVRDAAGGCPACLDALARTGEERAVRELAPGLRDRKSVV